PDDDVGLGELGEELLDLLPLGSAVAVLPEDLLEPEHRPHGVADRLVDLLDPGHLAVRHAAIVLRGESRGPGGCGQPWAVTWAAARRADAITAGIPTPSYAAPATARPGTSATAARIRATRSRWPGGYCGSPPPQRWT